MNHLSGIHLRISGHSSYKMNHPSGIHLRISGHGSYKMNHPSGTVVLLDPGREIKNPVGMIRFCRNRVSRRNIK